MAAIAVAQGFDQINTNGNGYLSDGDSQQQNRNFKKHNNDTTKNKEVPKGLREWTTRACTSS